MLATLNKELRRAIRSMAKGGLSAGAIANEFELPQSEVKAAITGSRYEYHGNGMVRLPQGFFWQ